MKKVLLLILSLTLIFFIFGCDNEAVPAGGGESKVIGSIVYFYDKEETVIKTFNSEDAQAKEIELLKETTYTIGLKPSFRGSKQVVYKGDCATFFFVEDSCVVTYIGMKNNYPTYEFVIKTDSDFNLTITVDNYSQNIKIIVQ